MTTVLDGVLKAIAGSSKRSLLASVTEKACLSIAVLVVLGVVAAGLAAFRLGMPSAAIALVLGTDVVLGAAVLAIVLRLSELFGQRVRDLRAQAILEALERGDANVPSFALYLRPFAATDQIDEETLAPMLAGSRGEVFGFVSTRHELERQLERATRAIGPLVALGQPLEHIGAGRIMVDEATWQAAVNRLAEAAGLIVLLPSSRAGTRWEIERILDSNLVQKTVVVDPPNMPKRNGRKFDQEAEWGQVRAFFAQRGFRVPEDSRDGHMLFYGADLTPMRTARLNIEDDGAIAEFISGVLRRLDEQKVLGGKSAA